MLIIESNAGRAFEVTAEGTRVWEFVNPHRAGDDDEFIATLFDLVRLPDSLVLDWIDKRRSQPASESGIPKIRSET